MGTLAAVHPLITRAEGSRPGTALGDNAGPAVAAVQFRHRTAARGGPALTEAPGRGGLGLTDAAWSLGAQRIV